MDEEQISKTRRKRDMDALQKLGEALVALPANRLHQLTLPERLADAVQEARRLNAREALRRQMQYIGRLMRDIDPAPIRARLAAWAGESRAETAFLHRIEHWRERLLNDPAALAELAGERPEADLQRLRVLIRNARREQAGHAPPRAARELFRQLRALFEIPDGAAPDPEEESEND